MITQCVSLCQKDKGAAPSKWTEVKDGAAQHTNIQRQ